jgi:hypothetical protein
VRIYTSIFLGLWFLGLSHFAPLPLAAFGHTFVTGDLADDASTYCAAKSCQQVCDCEGTPCDMEDDIRPLRAWSFIIFTMYLLQMPVLLVGLIGAVMEKSALLWYFPFGLFIHQLFNAIAGIGLGTTSDKAVLAWYLHNAKDFGDNGAACNDTWFQMVENLRVYRPSRLWHCGLFGWVFAPIWHTQPNVPGMI